MPLREQLLLSWGRRHIGEVIRRRALHRALRHLRPQCILDAGCGRGDNALWCARMFACPVDAVDIDERLVALAQRRFTAVHPLMLRAYRADIEQLATTPVGPPDARYAIIYSVDVFEHLAHPEEALRSLAGLLTPRGAILIHVPRVHQRRFFRKFVHYDQHDHARDGFEPEELVTLATCAGLHVAAMRHTFGPPGALAWELFQLAQGIGKWFALLTYPVPWLLAQIDGSFRWKRGNGILVTLRA
ncbi:MAG: class I SAM-dependent methyltransferase [bacterium]|nr:class I SAM-dependent methyltransferase [bacterium]